MFKSANNIFKNPTTYLYVSGVVALAALIISIIAMFTNDCKKSGFGDIVPGTGPGTGSPSKYGTWKLNSGNYCIILNDASGVCAYGGISDNVICPKNQTCIGIGGSDEHGRCITGTDKYCSPNQPSSDECTSIGKCCNYANQDADEECDDGYICSPNPDHKCEDKNCESEYTRKCVPKGADYCAKEGKTGPPCCSGLVLNPQTSKCVGKSKTMCKGKTRPNCKAAPLCEWSNVIDNCVPMSDDSGSSGSGSSGSGSSGSGSDIIINKKRINIGGNTIGGPGSTTPKSTLPPSAAPSHSPPSHSPSHSPSPSDPSDSDDLTWLWITLGSVGSLVLLGLIIYFATRKPKMGFGRTRMTGFGRPYPR